MKGFFTFLGIVAIIASLNNCGNNSHPDSTDEEAPYSNEVVAPEQDSSPWQSNVAVAAPEPMPQSNGVSLNTGAQPYDNEINASGNGAEIRVTTESGDTDYVVIVKRNGRIAKNAYINGGDSYTFNLAAGTYQVFFYSGEGWDSGKAMANGKTGGFLVDEHFSKDEPTTIQDQTLTYELYPQLQGNFNPTGSSEEEML